MTFGELAKGIFAEIEIKKKKSGFILLFAERISGFLFGFALSAQGSHEVIRKGQLKGEEKEGSDGAGLYMYILGEGK